MREQDATITRVIFRRWPTRHGGDVIAILLDVPENPGYVTCYQHVGQHGAGVYWAVMSQTRPASAEEYAPLKQELEAIGYRLILRKRRTVRVTR